MSATSATNLLGVVNACLRSVGERVVFNFTSTATVTNKALDAVRDSLQDISLLHDWNFAQETTVATSWSTFTATLPETHKIYGVLVKDGSRMRELLPVKRNDFPWLATTAEGLPELYYVQSNSKVLVHPYPNTSEKQNEVLFSYLAPLVLPTDATAFLPVPERFISLLIRGATAYLALSHLDDANAHTLYKRQFEEMGNRLRLREAGHTQDRNLFQRRVRR
jgi:hypothetical protein